MREDHDVFVSTGRQTFDEFFASRQPVTRLQFWGFLVLGGGLVASELSFAYLVLSQLQWTKPDVADFVVLLVFAGIGSAILWLGFLLIKRAFVGRAAEDKQSFGTTGK